MYTQQQVCVRWGGNTTHTVSISNGVKQGGVLSPVLFTVYMDELLVRLGKSRCGCYIGNIFCGALSYADDVIILAPTMSSVYSMLSICEKFANDYDVIFNASKSKLLIFPASFDGQHQYENISVHFMGGTIAYVPEHSHLGNIIGMSTDKRNIDNNVAYFYSKLNVLIR